MINIVRSLNFTNRRSMVILLTIFSMIVLPMILPTGILGVPFKEVTGGAYLINLSGEFFVVWIFPIMILGCIVASGDAGDKTLYYEIMAGHSRSSIFAARVLNAFVWSVLFTAFFYYLPLVYYGLINGWPTEGIRIGDIVIRGLLSLFPMLRISAFCIMLSVLFRSAGKGIGFSYLLIEVEILIIEIVKEFVKELDKKFLGGVYNVMDLMSFTNSRNYVINGEKVDVYDTALSGGYIFGTIAVSLLVTFVYLAAAYTDFTKRDRN
ncbi:MAG: hypothetical protein IK115_10490 [Lachnospiraceae bacterium]|nr:hypothetical protein [Lachnospiraceae bacterium]